MNTHSGRRRPQNSIEQLRSDIITAANIYSTLASKCFLYVYGDKYFEVTFPRRCFRHLCGVDSEESALRFYDDARDGKLDKAQIRFTRQKGQSVRVAKKKAMALKSLLSLVDQQVVVLEDLRTKTFTYQIGVTDLAITLCLEKELKNSPRNPVFGIYYPRSLRVDEKAIDKSDRAEFVDFIFAKNISIDSNSKYHEIVFRNDNREIPANIKKFIADSLWEDKLTNNR